MKKYVENIKEYGGNMKKYVASRLRRTKHRAKQGASRRILLSPCINALGLEKISSSPSMQALELEKIPKLTLCIGSGT